MEKDFQTSFIPKQAVVTETAMVPRGTSLLTIISIVIFLTMVVASGGLWFYKNLTVKSIEKMNTDLDLAKNRFEPAKIVQLEVLNRRLHAASLVLSRHIAVSPIFEQLQTVTMKTVRFTRFTYTLTDGPTPKVLVSMSGEGVGYRSIALQSDLFSQNKYFIDPIFSNLTLDSKGNVRFDLDFAVEPTFVNYQATLGAPEN